MKRRVVVCTLAATFATAACTHDWSHALVGEDAGEGGTTPARGGSAYAAAFDCTGAYVCDTFDGPPLGSTWDDVAVAPGGKVAIEPFDRALSPRNVLVAERPAQTNDATGSTAYLAKVRPGTLARAKMELQVWPVALDPTEYATVAAIVFDHQGAGEHKLRLALNQTRAQLQELGPSSVIASHDLPSGLPLDQWTPVTFGFDGGRIQVSVAGKTVLDVAADASWKPSPRSLFVVGINFVTRPHQRVSLRFDNVRIDG